MVKGHQLHIETMQKSQDGYRPNVGIILLNSENEVFWARRCGHDGWQFPQGGVKSNESLKQALFRELHEEVGLEPEHVQVVARTQRWLRYDLPVSYLKRLRSRNNRKFRGQKQIWYLLRLTGNESEVRLDKSTRPEFDHWIWKDWSTAIDEIIDFKRGVYRRAYLELKVHLLKHSHSPGVRR